MLVLVKLGVRARITGVNNTASTISPGVVFVHFLVHVFSSMFTSSHYLRGWGEWGSVADDQVPLGGQVAGHLGAGIADPSTQA